MRRGRARYRLWQIMLAIAVLAALFATFGVTGGIANGLVAGGIVLPMLLARPGHRLRTAAWVSSFYPLLLVFSLYASWLTTWVILGDRPHSSLEDPRFISPIAYISILILILGSRCSLMVSLPLMLMHIAQSNEWRPELPGKRAALIFVPILLWLSAHVILGVRSFGLDILEWYFDD